MAEPNGNVCVSVSVDVSAPISEHTTTERSASSSSSVPSSIGSGQSKNRIARQNSYGHGQNHYQHNPPNRTVPNQRNNGGFNSKGGRRGGDGFSNQNFANRRHQQPRGFNSWNNNRGGFNYNANARPLNTQQHYPVNRYLGPPPPPLPIPHSYPRSAPMLKPPYVPSPAPIPVPFMCYGNTFFPEASVPLYYPLGAYNPLYSPPVPPVPPYVDAMSGKLTDGKLADNTPILSNPEVTESWSVLPNPRIKENQPILQDPEVSDTSEFRLCDNILYQIEFYFCKNNLARDTYLKNLMDDEGWVPIHLIANFPKVKNLTKGIKEMTEKINVVLKALQPSTVVQVQGDKVRRRGDWMNWVKNSSSSAQMSSITCISTSIQNVHLGQNAEVDAQ